MEHNGSLLIVNDAPMVVAEGERVEMARVRFWTLGRYPLPAAERSRADCLEAIFQAMARSQSFEHAGRIIDFHEASSMEQKTRKGYF